MGDANRKKKNPEFVRQHLLDCAADLAAQEGFAQISLQKVASMAGVTKGGLFHHFSSKHELLSTLYREMLENIERMIVTRMAEERGYGAFTRAYISTLFDDLRAQERPSCAVTLPMMLEPEFCRMWQEWFGGLLARHKETDSDEWLEMIRYSADGVWLSSISGTQADLDRAEQWLLKATYKKVMI